MKIVMTGKRLAAGGLNQRRFSIAGAFRFALALSFVSAVFACGAEDEPGVVPDAPDVLAWLIPGPSSSQLVSENSGKCLDVYRGNSENDTPIIQYRCGDVQSNQRWEMRDAGDGYVYLVCNDKCADVYKGSLSNNAPVNLYECKGQPNQKWWVNRSADRRIYFVGVQSGKCLTVADASGSDGARIVQYDCNEGRNQYWTEENLFLQ